MKPKHIHHSENQEWCVNIQPVIWPWNSCPLHNGGFLGTPGAALGRTCTVYTSYERTTDCNHQSLSTDCYWSVQQKYVNLIEIVPMVHPTQSNTIYMNHKTQYSWSAWSAHILTPYAKAVFQYALCCVTKQNIESMMMTILSAAICMDLYWVDLSGTACCALLMRHVWQFMISMCAYTCDHEGFG